MQNFKFYSLAHTNTEPSLPPHCCHMLRIQALDLDSTFSDLPDLLELRKAESIRRQDRKSTSVETEHKDGRTLAKMSL